MAYYWLCMKSQWLRQPEISLAVYDILAMHEISMAKACSLGYPWLVYDILAMYVMPLAEAV